VTTATTSEGVLLALMSAIQAAAPAGAKVLRNEVIPQRIPAAGVMILRDGVPGDPEVLLSPLTYLYNHRAEVDLIVDRPGPGRDAAFDALKAAVGAAVAADRTLGGLCDYVLAEAAAPLMVPIEGAEGFKAATISVDLIYGSADPLL
jgi:hypothetical protein